jgi:hypothetical protein
MLIATMQHPERSSLFDYVMELRFEGMISLCSFRDCGKIVQNMTLILSIPWCEILLYGRQLAVNASLKQETYYVNVGNRKFW